MNPRSFVALYEKIESLVHRLPESLQSPILREISPIKSIFLLQRPPRVLLLGDRSASRTELINRLFRAEVATPEEDHLQNGTWQVFSRNGCGRCRVLDARRPASSAVVGRALTEEPPDICIFLHSEPRAEAEAIADLDHAAALLRLVREKHPEARPEVFGVALGTGAIDAARLNLHRLLDETPGHRLGEVVSGIFVLPGVGDETHRFALAVAKDLPPEARLEMARLSGLREVQHETASIVIKSMTAISGAIATQPIPLADFPILATLQASLVASIMYISGRELSMKAAASFLTALGATLGLGLVLRESARALVKVVPVWGELVSGGVAAAGTFAVGRAAAGYFIDGLSLPDARQVFQNKRKAAKALKDKV